MAALSVQPVVDYSGHDSKKQVEAVRPNLYSINPVVFSTNRRRGVPVR
jgi:hypothetical protein